MSRKKNGGNRRDRNSDGRPSTDNQRDQGITPEREGRDWADEAAEARTADDPRAVTPHDRAGVPSTGDLH